MARISDGFLGERAVHLPDSIFREPINDELFSMLNIKDIGYFPKAKYHYFRRTSAESTNYLFIYCTEGYGWYELDGVKYKVLPQHFFILPKGKAHAYGSDIKNPWTIYWIHFDGKKANFFADGFDRLTHISSEKSSRIEERIQLFEEILSTLKGGYSIDNLQYSSTLLMHFFGSIKFIKLYREHNNDKNSQVDVVDEAIHFMRENMNRNLTLKDIADYVRYSPSHISSLFKRKTGCSPLNYLIDLKIKKACYYLCFTELKINQICMMVGIEDPLYFSRIFTKKMSVSATEYRNTHNDDVK
ncbi:MAG: AraC family transcriptional regulator [Bacteroidetes bacterium]|nr:AraC family transcriptional regulator [Bacteroidota bacterium]